MAQNTTGRRSALDDHTTRHPGYAISQRIRKRVEEAFGWAKTVAGLRKMRHRGLLKVDWQFTLAMAAYDVVRLLQIARSGYLMILHTDQTGCCFSARPPFGRSQNAPTTPPDHPGSQIALNSGIFSTLLGIDVAKISVGRAPPHDINVVVEIPQGGVPVKYEVDKVSGAVFVDRLLHTAMFYPGNYGFVPHTLALDGDPIDVLVVGPAAVVPGAVVRCRLCRLSSGSDCPFLFVTTKTWKQANGSRSRGGPVPRRPPLSFRPQSRAAG